MSRHSLSLTGEPEVPLYAGDIAADLGIVARGGLAEQITGGLSFTQKMPCPSWGIPATRCQLGSVLAQKPGTVCSESYAMKNHFNFPAVQSAMERRYRALFHPLGVPALVLLIQKKREECFRWHTSGDLQSVTHQQDIATVAVHTPRTAQWLPTGEGSMVKQVPDLSQNHVIRVSPHQIEWSRPRGSRTL